MLRDLGERLAAGQVEIAPRPQACATCPYSSVCRIDPWRLLLSVSDEGDEGDDAEGE